MDFDNLNNSLIEEKIELNNIPKKGIMIINSCKNKLNAMNKINNNTHYQLRELNRIIKRDKIDLAEKINQLGFKERVIYDGFLTFVMKSNEISDWHYFLLTEKLLIYPSQILITALIIFKRFIKMTTRISQNLSCFFKLFLGCILLASKCIDDFSYQGEDVMNQWNGDPASILKIESHILKTIDFDLNIKDSEYKWVIYHISTINNK